MTELLLDSTFYYFILTEDAGLCGLNGCPFHGMCLRDSELGKYQCQCPECYTQDLPNYVCGKSYFKSPFIWSKFMRWKNWIKVIKKIFDEMLTLCIIYDCVNSRSLTIHDYF